MDDRNGQSPRRRRGRIVVSALGVAIVAAIVVASIALGPRLKSWVTDEAGKRGVRLAFTDYSLGWGEVALEGVSFARERPLPISGQAKRVIVHWVPFELERVEIEALEVDILSSVPDLLYELRSLSSETKGGDLPITATGSRLRWKTSSQDPGTVTLSNASLALDSERLQASGELRTADQLLGNAVIASAFATHKSTVELAFSGEATGNLSAAINTAADPAIVQVTLKPTQVKRDLPGLRLRSSNAGTISGSLDLNFPTGLSAQPSKGKVSLNFDGFVPPHPPELQGFPFGNRTSLESDVTLSRDYRTATLKNIRFDAGPFALTGSGTIERHDGYATTHMQLGGRISCASIASAAAEAALGGALGQILGNAARQTMDGSVDVAIKAQADSRDLDAMQIEKTIGLGCGLRPTKLNPPPLPR